jgi:hypothetical protein
MLRWMVDLQSFRRTARRACGAAGLAFPLAAHASFLPPALMNSAAWGIAWFVIVVMPIAVIVLFWMVHVLPEKIAERRHHPQKDAIQVLCLLSLVFGGLLWPIAWLWAYTRPTTSYLAYGTEKHEDYFHHMGERFRAGQLSDDEVEELRDELDAVASKSRLPRPLKALRRELDARQPALAAAQAGDA